MLFKTALTPTGHKMDFQSVYEQESRKPVFVVKHNGHKSGDYRVE